MKPKKRSAGSVNSKGELVALQRSFAQAIRRPLTDDDSMNAWRETDTMIAPTQNMRPHDRLELYAQQYWWRIEEAFDEDFTTVQLVMRDATYRKLRDVYLDKHPSRYFSLRNLGQKFPSFVLKNPKLTGAKRRLIHACALFDWARVDAFDAAELAPITPKDTAHKNFMNQMLYLQPHVQLLFLGYPVDQLVKEGPRDERHAASNTALPEKKRTRAGAERAVPAAPTYLAVHRHNERVLMKRLTKFQYEMLIALKKGVSLKRLVSKASTKRSAAEDLGNAFQDWSSLGWLSLKKPKTTGGKTR